MSLNFSSQTNINPGSRNPPYTILNFQGKNYRILSRQRNGFIQMAKIWSVFWYSVCTLLLISSIVLFFQLKISYILIFAFACCLGFTIYAFKKRDQIANSLLYSVINLLVFLIPITILAMLQIKQIILPLIFYSNIVSQALVTFQTILSIKYMTNKSQIIAKFLILMEAIMIGLKVDQKIQSSWRDILFSHVVFFLFLALCVLFMTVYLIYMKAQNNQQNLMKLKLPGTLFIYFNTVGFCSLSALPLFNVMFGFQLWTVCLAQSFVYAFIATYCMANRNQIVVFFCTLNQIKSFDQIIAFQPLQKIKNKKNQKPDQNDISLTESINLYKISQNWLTKDVQKALQYRQSNSQNPETGDSNKNQKHTDCIICMDKDAQVVWMPCGHLTVCMQCCSFMLDKKNLNCVLCKIVPEQIFIIDIEKQKTLQLEKELERKDSKSLDMSLQKDEVSVISTSIFVKKDQHNANKDAKSELGSNKKLKNKSQNNQIQNYRVLQGYNVKII